MHYFGFESNQCFSKGKSQSIESWNTGKFTVFITNLVENIKPIKLLDSFTEFNSLTVSTKIGPQKFSEELSRFEKWNRGLVWGRVKWVGHYFDKLTNWAIETSRKYWLHLSYLGATKMRPWLTGVNGKGHLLSRVTTSIS